MFIGELLCLFAYGAKLLFLKYQRSKNGHIEVQEEVTGKQLRTNINPLLLAIPAAFDVIASSLMNIALTEVAASVYQMLRGMKIVVTAGMSILFLKKKLYIHHWSSVGCIFFGLILVGIAVLTGDSSSSIGSSPLGIIILLIATVFSSCLYIVEEKILGDYYLDPLKVVGLEGLWGLTIWTVLLPVFQQITCTSDKLCPYGKLEDTMQAFRDYGANSTLIWLSVAVCFTMAFFNGFGVAVTKNASSA
jgi:drug/metabolite transporter (DMT)-like permease